MGNLHQQRKTPVSETGAVLNWSVMVLETYGIKISCRYDNCGASVCQFCHKPVTGAASEKIRCKQSKLN